MSVMTTTEKAGYDALVSGAAQALKKDGSVALTADLPMGTHALTGLRAGAASGESVRYEQTLDAMNYLLQDPGSFPDVCVEDFDTGGSAATGAVIIVNGSSFGRAGFRAGSSAALVSLVSTAQDNKHIGVVQLDRGTTAGNVSSIAIQAAGTLNPLQLGANQNWTQDWIIQIPTLSDGTNTYALRFGYTDTSGALPVNGAYIEANVPATTTWKVVGMAATVPTLGTGGTPTTVVAGAWIHLRNIWDGTTFSCSVDGVSIGSTTTVPTGVNLCEFAHILGSAGTTSRTVLIDRFSRIRKFTGRAA